MSNPLNDPNRSSSLISTNPSLLPPNTFTGTQSTMPPTATRNPSIPTATKKPNNSTLAGLLTPSTPGGYQTSGVLPAPNGTNPFGNVYAGQNLLNDTNKPPQATKNTTPMTGISAGLASRGSGKGSRGPGKGSRGAGAGGSGPKRLVKIFKKN